VRKVAKLRVRRQEAELLNAYTLEL